MSEGTMCKHPGCKLYATTCEAHLRTFAQEWTTAGAAAAEARIAKAEKALRSEYSAQIRVDLAIDALSCGKKLSGG
jgi:hypothetical protein